MAKKPVARFDIRRPRVLIAGTGSGVGKTTVTVALLRALTRRGLTVSAFKVGPDFLDPTYLAIASGRPCHNLDGWMMGAAYAADLFERASRDADISVVEGVMGLFDGSSPSSLAGSSAEIAKLLAAPVVLVAGAHGMSRSFAAQVRGYVGFEPGVDIAGVIANNTGSARHASDLAESLRVAGLPQLVGAIPRGALATLPSRHLGLVTADRSLLGEGALDTLADALEKHVDLEAVIALARAAAPMPGEPTATSCADPGGNDYTVTVGPPLTRRRLRLGLACDEAFHFYYADTLTSLEHAGFELVRFSPLSDGMPPEGLHGLYLGGGYPEAFAAELSANETMRRAVLAFAESGRPVLAECGGLMYLSRWISTASGERHAMCGVLPCGTRMLKMRKALGYVEAELAEDSLWGSAGDIARGHEFHYSELAGDPTGQDGWRSVYRLRRSRGGEQEMEGFTNGTVLASYVHLHFASRPDMARRLHRKCGAEKGTDLFSMNSSEGTENVAGSKINLPPFSSRPRIHMVIEGRQAPDAIEAASFAAIDAEAPRHEFTPWQWRVVQRMIHAAADLALAGSTRFSEGAVEAAVAALRAGRPLLVDSNMIRAGLSLPRLRRANPEYGPARVFCHIADEDVAIAARAAGLPRSLFAVRKAREMLDGGIAVFGNAPVALLELNRMIVEDGVRPALVVALPVGFVHVVESKEELMELDVPYIAVAGRKGGSPLAVAAIHALCSLAEEMR